MDRADYEITTPIDRDELIGLLDTMTPPEQQPITVRASISAVDAALSREQPATDSRVFCDVDWDDLLGAAVAAMVTPTRPAAIAPPIPTSTRPKRKYARPFSQVAALLEGYEPTRFPRATRPPTVRAKTQTGSPEAKAAQAVADVRARLDSAGEEAAQRFAAGEYAAFPVLSPQVAAHLSGEEISMLPMEIRLTLPDVPAWMASPRIEMTPVPGASLIALPRSTNAADGFAEELVPVRLMTILASFTIAFLVGFCVSYFLL